ncbi:MAG: D-alanine--D-alanine ligase [Candidatus Omnitrophica bacterium CG23_combo_of_CG06-09_8_20_14_all_41_10]|uniref:D-alanine--D-alanine ligase n=1 Tax=Candidatus Sherwoodlollariibacterium unditelluris TaxID=1974757 RepID=A0A2G9YHP4_9BACT|nr:MAG: D-alanine--D-alanine ligase [Candidatus Omnitrophica bacterium CG23_combo_of_CG06-09_8_20_14_all_41_10]
MGINSRTCELANSRTNFGRIGVLMGGPSSEKKISLKSGHAVLNILKESGQKVVPIIIKTDKVKNNVRLLKSSNIDCAFIALHGSFGEDGGIQKILESLKVPYTGSGVRASKLAMDKVASRNIFKKHGLNVPPSKVISENSYKIGNIDKFGLPLVVKPATQGSSIGLSIVDSYKNIPKAINLAFKFDKRIIIEEYIRGRELTVGILKEKALPVIEIIPKHFFFDYQAKYKQGLTDYIVPAKLSFKAALRIKKAALSAHKLLGCFGCSRVDIILDDAGNPFILEVNTIPGFTSTSLLPKAAKSAGIDFNHLCLELIKLAYGPRTF